MPWTWDFEVTDRQAWPSSWGRITVLADTEREAFAYAFEAVMVSTRAAMVTRLDLVDWKED